MFTLLNFTSMRRLQSLSPFEVVQFLSSFEHFNDVISPKILLANSSFPKGFLLAPLAENLQITSGYLSLQTYALFATVLLRPSP
jgi:hypothetical protein